MLHDPLPRRLLNFSLNLETARITAPRQLELWIEWLGLDLPVEPHIDSGTSIANDSIRHLLGCYCSLLSHIFHLARLPIFDKPVITALDTTPLNRTQARITVPCLDNIHPAIMQAALTHTTRTWQLICWNVYNEESRAELSQYLAEHVLGSLLRQTHGGLSTIPTLRAAHALDIPFMHLGRGVYQLGWGSKARRLSRSCTQSDSLIGAGLTHDKAASASLLRMAGLPAPVHAVVSSQPEWAKIIESIGFPAVVKPVDKDRGEGVTVDLSDDASLQAAFLRAHKLSPTGRVLVERQAQGVCHRIFVAQGKLLYAVKRHPMSVRGDGRRTVKQLVADELDLQLQLPPWKRSKLQALDRLALDALAGSGMTAESVPQAGVLAPLRRIESTEWGGVDEEVTHTIHPDNIALAVQASRLFDLDMAGIDIISTDITRPWHENAAILNEVNASPLLGGGEISRAYLPAFFANFIEGNGRIPVETFQDIESARRRRREWLDSGLRCFLTTDKLTLDATGQAVMLSFDTRWQRARALLCRPDVDAIVIAPLSNS